MLSDDERKEMQLHPFKRMRDKVAMVGFSRATRHMAPFDDDEYEIFGLNEEYAKTPHQIENKFEYKTWMKRYDRWFQLHPYDDFMRKTNQNDRNHPLWLLNKTGTCIACNGTKVWHNFLNGGAEEPCPFCDNGVYTPLPGRDGLVIYMQQKYSDVPGSVRYPLKEIAENFMPKSMVDTKRNYYFRSSPAYMIALALAMGYKKIDLYGFEMGTDTEYHYQRANFEYWMGRAQGMGVELWLPEESSLLRGDLYAYESMKVGYRQDLEMRKVFLEQRIKEAQKDQYVAKGVVKGLKLLEKDGKYIIGTSPSGEQVELIPRAEIEEAVNAAEIAHAKAQSMTNFKSGAEKEVEMQIKMYDMYFNAETRENKEPKTTELVNTDYAFD